MDAVTEGTWAQGLTFPLELRLVLLGQTGVGKSATGNTILGAEEFPSRTSASGTTRHCQSGSVKIKGRRVTVVDTPGLLDTRLSPEETLFLRDRCLSLSDPGPHALLLVLKGGPFSDKDRRAADRVRELFGEEALRFTVVLFTRGDDLEQQSLEEFVRGNRDLQLLVQQCGGRCHLFNNKSRSDRAQVRELLNLIDRMATDNMVRQNGGGFYSSQRRIVNQSERKTQNTVQEGAANSVNKEEMRIVLVGKTGSGKSATGNTILGREAFTSRSTFESVTRHCEKAQGAGVSVIDTPGLCDTALTEEQVKREIVRSILLTSPGPHTFLLVMRFGRYTEEEVNTINTIISLIQQTFGAGAADYIMILFTHTDELRGGQIEACLQQSGRAMKQLMEKCGDRYHAFNNVSGDPRQVTELMEKIRRMVAQNQGSFYTSEMYQRAEELIRREQERLMEERREVMETEIEGETTKQIEEITAYRKKKEEEIIKQNLDATATEKKIKDLEEEAEEKVQEIKKQIRRRVVHKHTSMARDVAENVSMEKFKLVLKTMVPLTTGAAAGAAVGMFAGPIGAGVGAALGAVTGMIVFKDALVLPTDKKKSCCIQ